MSKIKNTVVATINKDLASAYLDKKGNFNAIQFDKDGNENHKLVTNKTVAENSAVLCYVSEIASMIDKAQCYHLAQIKDSIVKNFGFKGIADYCETNFRQAIGDKSTVSRKRSVGRMFVQMLINEDGTSTYYYRDGIPFDASISALVEVLGLLTDDNGEPLDMKKTEEFTEDEITDSVARFVADYIETDLIHLSLPTKRVREEVKAIRNANTSTNSDKTDDNYEKTAEKDKHTTTRLESVKACIDRIAKLLGDNEKVADALAVIVEVAETVFANDKDETETETETETE